MKYNIIVSMLVFIFLTACNPDFKINQKDVWGGSNKKELNPNQEAKDLEKNKIPASRLRESVTDLPRTDMAVKIAVDNNETGNKLISIGSAIAVPTEESSKSTRSTDGIEVTELPESIKSQEIPSIKIAQGQKKLELEPAKAEEEQRRKAAEEERQRQEEEKNRAKDTIKILTKKIDGINKDIDAIKQRENLSLHNAEESIRPQEVINKITGPIYDYFTDDINYSIYNAWYDLDTDLEELLKELRNTRSDLRAKLNEGNQRYIGIGNEPKLKENIMVDEIESDLDKIKLKLKGVKEYLKTDSNFEKITKNIVNSDDE
ncbi:hypothetical protein [Borreliella valaisiana]|uniref:hypothetical protein n=1 Tax=Borreliella valaisiana TaxID=62088 RepID=UPI003BA0C5B7